VQANGHACCGGKSREVPSVRRSVKPLSIPTDSTVAATVVGQYLSFSKEQLAKI